MLCASRRLVHSSDPEPLRRTHGLEKGRIEDAPPASDSTRRLSRMRAAVENDGLCRSLLTPRRRRAGRSRLSRCDLALDARSEGVGEENRLHPKCGVEERDRRSWVVWRGQKTSVLWVANARAHSPSRDPVRRRSARAPGRRSPSRPPGRGRTRLASGRVDRRRLYLREACPSMHVYATQRLRMSDAEAYLRITVARVSRRLPVVLALLADGRLHLSAIAKLAPHLGNENGEALLGRAVHKSKRAIEVLIAELAPRPDVPSLMRRLPAELRPDGVQIRAVGDGPPPAVF